MVLYQTFGTDYISNILVSSGGITMLQKPLFSILFCEIDFCFLLQKNECNSDNNNHRGG